MSSRNAIQRRKALFGVEAIRPPILDKSAGGTAWCSRCKADLPLEAFGKRKASWCRACASAQAKVDRQKMIEAESLLPPDSPKRCGRCKETKTLAEFQRGVRCCRVCQNQKVADYEARYPERKKARAKVYCDTHKEECAQRLRDHRKNNRAWWKEWEKNYNNSEKGRIVRRNIAHRRRVALADSTVTSDQMVALKRKAKGRCYYCQEKCKNLSFDHIIPIARGGKHSLDNLVMACMPCNQSKSGGDPLKFARSKGALLV